MKHLVVSAEQLPLLNSTLKEAGFDLVKSQLVSKGDEKKARDFVNKELEVLTYNNYFESLPIQDIANILTKYGFNTEELHGIYVGREGRVHDQVGPNTWIVITWHKMESGRYEVGSYVS
jgi:hypothetical protein